MSQPSQIIPPTSGGFTKPWWEQFQLPQPPISWPTNDWGFFRSMQPGGPQMQRDVDVNQLIQIAGQLLPQIFSWFRSMPATSQGMPGMQQPGGPMQRDVQQPGGQMQQRDWDWGSIFSAAIPIVLSFLRSMPATPQGMPGTQQPGGQMQRDVDVNQLIQIAGQLLPQIFSWFRSMPATSQGMPGMQQR
jgi:hypothetical protein